MELKFGDIQETTLIPLAISGSMWICPIRSQSGVRCIMTGNAAQCLTEVRSNLHGQKHSRNRT